MNHEQLHKRLSSKSVRQSIIMKLGRDFNLTPILAEAYFNQVQEYFLAHGQIDLATGQLHYLAIDENEPAGKPVALCKKISVKLSLHQPEEDLTVSGSLACAPSGNTGSFASPTKPSSKVVSSPTKTSPSCSPPASSPSGGEW